MFPSQNNLVRKVQIMRAKYGEKNGLSKTSTQTCVTLTQGGQVTFISSAFRTLVLPRSHPRFSLSEYFISSLFYFFFLVIRFSGNEEHLGKQR